MPPAQANNNQPRMTQTINPDRQLARVRFSRDGRILAAAGNDATVRRWEVTDTAFNALPHLTGHKGWVDTIAFHPDGRRLFSADSWGEIRIWPYADREARPIRTIPSAHNGWIRDLAISPDGRTFATCGRDEKVILWSADDGRKLHELTGHNDDVYSVVFSPDNRFVVSGDLHGNVKQWDVAAGRKTRDFAALTQLYRISGIKEQGGIRCLLFAPNGSLAIAGSQPAANGGTPTILIYDFAAARLLHTLTINDANAGYVFDLAFHSSGYIMAVTSGTPGNGKFYFHRPGEQAPFFLNTSMPNCHSLAVHPSSPRIVVAATNGGSNGNGRNLRNGEYPGNFSPLHVWTLPT